MTDFTIKQLSIQDATDLADLLGPGVDVLLDQGIPPGGAVLACLTCAVLLHRQVVGNNQDEADATVVNTFRSLLEAISLTDNLVDDPGTVQ